MPERTDTPYPQRWWMLVVLSASLLVIGLDNTILNVALPTLERDLGASSSQLQWIVDAYMLVFAGLLLTAGALGDRFGRKRGLSIGLAIFGLGSGLSALATSPEMLIATRALMGVGGAFIMPSTLSIITAVFPSNERAKAIGIWAGVSGLGIAIGPVAGGWLIEHASWNAVFLVNLPFVVAALTAGRWLVPESKDPAAPRLDLPGFALSIAGLTTLVWAIIEAPSRGWTDPTILAAFGIAAGILAAFMAWELRASQPMLDIRLFRNPRFSGASAAITLVFFSMFGTIFFLTQYLQGVLDYTALEAGIRVTPVAAGLILGGPISAKLAERFGTKRVVAGGLVLVAAGLSIVTQFHVDSSYGIVAAHLLVLGFGMGMAMAPATESVMGSLPIEKASVGSAVNDMTRTTGGALGVAILGSLLASQYRGDMDEAVSGLPHGAAESASDTLSGGLAVAHRLGDAGLADAAQTAFVSGMHIAALAAAAVALVGAIVAYVGDPGARGAARVRARGRPCRGARPRMSETAESPRRTPGRPRSEASHQAIINATLDLLVEGGYGALTMEAVRTRAGVGKATIYRRWASKDELVRDAIVFLHDEFEAPDTGSLRGDYEALAQLVRASASRGGTTLMPRLLGEAVNEPELFAIFRANLVEPRRAALRTVLERAVARGEIREGLDLEMVLDLFAGPVVYRLLITGGDMSQMFAVEAQMDALMNGLAP